MTALISAIVVGIFGVWLRFYFKERRANNVTTSPAPNKPLRNKFSKRVRKLLGKR